MAKTSHEAIEVNERRGLLVTTQGGLVAQYIEVYDVTGDCAHPKFLGRYDAGIPIFHGLKVADDGRTVYATDTFGISGAGQMHPRGRHQRPARPRSAWSRGTRSPRARRSSTRSHDEDDQRATATASTSGPPP